MSKKTETIEIRVSPELKAELAEKSRAEGKTMSGFLRDRITTPAGAHLTQGESKMTKTSKRFALIAAPALAVAAVYSVMAPAAAIATPEIRATFAQMDLNGDGTVTTDEYRQFLTGDIASFEDEGLPQACAADLSKMIAYDSAALQAELDAIDADGDKTVTYDELRGQMIRQAAQDFLDLDKNEDGYLSADELLDDISFDLADLDLSDEELAALETDDAAALSAPCLAALEAEWGAMGAEAEAEDLLTEEDLASYGQALFEDETKTLVAALDADRDGRISLEEYLAQ